MCTLCHALTPRNNSGAHYRWHQEQLDLIKAMRTEYRTLTAGGTR